MTIERIHLPEGVPLDHHLSADENIAMIREEHSSQAMALPTGRYILTPTVYLDVQQNGEGILTTYKKPPHKRKDDEIKSRIMIPQEQSLITIVRSKREDYPWPHFFDIIYHAPGESPPIKISSH